ncbi:MAG: hypothetical protein PHS47_03000 [Methanocellales archaeon]|nr:hypothetical protein [Methanocellales archaeon]MDD3421250.1 hypothetical protein [Methanocellales archaeon]MDD4898534.1 hypothetical protein [Methanocellales archaeon]
MKWQALFGISLFMLLILTTYPVQAAGPTTEVHVVKYSTDGKILKEITVNYQWMGTNLPIYGDGVTHYFHQGPIFEGDKWDQNETANFKDRGAVKGTDIKDLCELVGGMSPGDDVMVHAPDGYHVEFNYKNVYEPQPRQGPLVICWYNGEDVEVGERQGMGYPPDYYTGMRLVFFADDSVNPEHKHVFGNWDMHECLPEQSQHFYGDLYPSTSGLTVKWVDEIRIYSGGYTSEKSNLEKSPATTPIGFESLFAIAGLLIAGLLLVFYAFRRAYGGKR